MIRGTFPGSRAAGALTLGIALVWPLGVRAQEPDSMRRIDFSVSRDREVANDLATATLAVTRDGADPAALANEVNHAMSDALERARDEPAVRARTTGYQTQPIYSKGEIRHWRASQQLALESRDFDALTELIGSLQSSLELTSIGFSVSPELRRSTQDDLIGEALAAYQARAESVRGALGARGHELVHLSIETPGDSGPWPPFARQVSSMASAEMAAPAVEAGTSRIQILVRATIELR
jgi:predicted secreted protein